MLTIWKMTFFCCDCPVFSFSHHQNIWSDSETMGVKKASLPWKKKKKNRGKSIFQCTAALLTLSGDFTGSTHGANAGLPALTLTHKTSESHSPTHTMYYWLVSVTCLLYWLMSSLSPKISPHRRKQLAMARFPELLFRCRFGGRKLCFFYTCFILPFSLVMQLWTLPRPR